MNWSVRDGLSVRKDLVVGLEDLADEKRIMRQKWFIPRLSRNTNDNIFKIVRLVQSLILVATIVHLNLKANTTLVFIKY